MKPKTNNEAIKKHQNLQFLNVFFTTLFSAVGEEPHSKSMESHDYLLSCERVWHKLYRDILFIR